jgi:hypothetical protein
MSIDTVLGLQCTIAVSDEKIVEELHIEVIVFDDQHLLPYRSIGVHLRVHKVQRHAPSLERDRSCPKPLRLREALRRGEPATAGSAPAPPMLSKGSSLIIRNRSP